MKRSLLILTLVATALAAAVPASAQLTPPRAQRPYRGLFGGGLADPSQQLILNLSLGSGYDDDLTDLSAASPPLPVPTLQRNGVFSSGSASLSYTVSRDSVQGSLTAGANGRYYPGLTDPLVGTYSASGQLSFKLSSRTTLSTSHSAGVYLRNLAAFYSDGFGQGILPTTPVDSAAFNDTDTYLGFQSSVQLSQGLTSRLSLSGSYVYYVNDAWSSNVNRRNAVQAASGGVSYVLGKGLGLRFGYSLSNSWFGSGQRTPFRGRAFDGGIDFNRALSLSRRTTLSFSTGLAGLSDQNLNVRYFVTGQVNLAHEIGRTWSLSTGYNRSASLDQTLGQPVFTDGVSAGFGGLISRRLQLNTSAMLLKGVLGITAGAPGYTAASAGIGLTLGITRTLGLGVNYGFYRYQFDSGAVLPPGMLPRMDRQSVGVSLNFWVPLMTRARRANAAG